MRAKVVALGVVERRDAPRREASKRAGDRLGAEAGRVDDDGRGDVQRLRAADGKADTGLAHRPGEDRAGQRQNRAGRLRLAEQAEHEAVGVENAGRRRVQRRDAMQCRLHHPRRGAIQPADVLDPVAPGPVLEGAQRRQFDFAGGDDELAAAFMADAVPRQVVVEALAAAATEPRLQAVRRVVDPGVDDFGIARTDLAAEGGVGLDDDHLATGPGQAAGDRQADDPGADDDTLDPFSHVRPKPVSKPSRSLSRSVSSKTVR